jgi:hypothetical protein
MQNRILFLTLRSRTGTPVRSDRPLWATLNTANAKLSANVARGLTQPHISAHIRSRL